MPILISRKIWPMEKYLSFHTVFLLFLMESNINCQKLSVYCIVYASWIELLIDNRTRLVRDVISNVVYQLFLYGRYLTNISWEILFYTTQTPKHSFYQLSIFCEIDFKYLLSALKIAFLIGQWIHIHGNSHSKEIFSISWNIISLQF